MENQGHRRSSKCCRLLVVEEFEGENKNCNRCLDYRRKCYEKHKEQYQEEANRRWKEDEEYRKKKQARKQIWNNLDFTCDVCDCLVKKCNKVRHEKTNKHVINLVVNTEK